MKDTTIGWVIINIGHPVTGSSYICNHTFCSKRTESIKSFIKDSGNTWEFWKRNYNFRCVKAESQITIYQLNNPLN
jgi:uncharacterized protein (DUF2237 family)